MPARHSEFTLAFQGGWATNINGGVTAQLEQGVIALPYLSEATNVLFDGSSIRAVGGALLATTESYGDITALLPVAGGNDRPDVYTVHDSQGIIGWRLGTGSEEATFVEQITPSVPASTDAEWTVAEFEGYTIIATDDINIRPLLISSTTFTYLQSAEPNFSMAATYAGRLWVAGDNTNPSRLYYSDLNDPTQGYASNFFDIDPFEGSAITALVMFRDTLFIFKGPLDGSIHTLSGKTPSTFALKEFSKSIGCGGPNATAEFGNDVLFFGSDGQIHSLATTQNFGDFERSNQSLPIADYLRTRVPTAEIRRVHLAADSATSRVWISLPTGNTRASRQVIVMDYANGNKFTKIDYITSSHIIPARAASATFGKNYLLANQGEYLYRIDVEGEERIETLDTNGDIVESAYLSKVTTPPLKFLPTFGSNTIARAGVALEASSRAPTLTEIAYYQINNTELFDPSTEFDLVWRRDLNDPESASIQQAFGSRLGVFYISGTTAYQLPEVGAFILGTSRLGGPRAIESYKELESWDFRRVALGFEKEELNSGATIHSITIQVTSEDATNTENQLI